MQHELLAPSSPAATFAEAGRPSVVREWVGRGLLFLTVWLLYGMLIETFNLRGYMLHQAGGAAIVERGCFYLDGSSTPDFAPKDYDIFSYGGHSYAAKQPGQFFFGAMVYGLLHLCGLTYLKKLILTSALVTFLTASLVAAASAVAVFELARGLASPLASRLWPLGTALAYALATTVLPYAGIAHHDVLATGYLVLAFWCVSALARAPGARGNEWRAAAAGLLLGLTGTTSMLPFLPVLVLAGYFLGLRQRRLVPFFAASGLLGLLPLFVYNTVSFGNPLLMPNMAGHFTDTYFRLDWADFISKVAFYAAMLLGYAPICWCGLAGLTLFPRSLRRERGMLLALMASLAAYILNIETVGGWQYGPRYLLPVMPFLTLGLVGFSYLPPRRLRWAVGALVPIGLFSALTNLAGAIGGCGYDEIRAYALPLYLKAFRYGVFPEFPLAWALAVPLVVCAVGLVLWFRASTFDSRSPLPV
jgi:hypothetical protein